METTEYFKNKDSEYEGVIVPKQYIVFLSKDFQFEWPLSLKKKTEDKQYLNVEDQKFIISSFSHFLTTHHLYHCRNILQFMRLKLEIFNYMGSAFKDMMIRKFSQNMKYINKNSTLAKHQVNVFSLKYSKGEVLKTTSTLKYPNMVCKYLHII